MVPRALRRILLLLVVGSVSVVRATPLVAAGDPSSQVPALGQSAGRSAGAPTREAEIPGDPAACYREGTAYANGAGVARDEGRAAALFQRACDGGVMSGCANLGWLYFSGHGVAKDDARASALFQKACGDPRLCLGSSTSEALPPGNAMSLGVPAARRGVRRALADAYAGPTHRGMGWPKVVLAPRDNVSVGGEGLEWDHAYQLNGAPVRLRGRLVFRAAPYLEVVEDHWKVPGSVFYLSPGQCERGEWGDNVSCAGCGGWEGRFVCQDRYWNSLLFTNRQSAQYAAVAVNRLIYAARHPDRDPEPASFRRHAAEWRRLAERPALPEAVHREQVLGEYAVHEKDNAGALDHYERGLAAYDTWPEGWFNAALISAELQDYPTAVDYMKRYLELVPDAPDARNARDQVTIWEEKATR
jgi:hypothetical protein